MAGRGRNKSSCRYVLDLWPNKRRRRHQFLSISNIGRVNVQFSRFIRRRRVRNERETALVERSHSGKPHDNIRRTQLLARTIKLCGLDDIGHQADPKLFVKKNLSQFSPRMPGNFLVTKPGRAQAGFDVAEITIVLEP